MGWRSIISREALSGSLEQFPPASWQARTGAKKSVSKPKLQALTQAKKGSAKIARASEKHFNIARSLMARPVVQRFGLHGLVAAVIAVIVITGSSTSSSQTSLMTGTADLGAVMDEAAVANVVASVAEKANLSVANDASEAATALNSQVAIPTANADFIAKKQVVATSNAGQHAITSYTVADGDTLSAIASKFNITTSTLKWSNNLTDADSIKPGQTLTILPISGLLYTVQAGDTAESLASKYQSNAAQIISFNDAELKGLTPGQQIIIPDGVKAEAPAPRVNANVAYSSRGGGRLLPRYSLGGNSYAYGYCTYYVAGRRYVPSNWGNANSWLYNARAAGYSTGSAPAVGAIAWEGTGYYGHVSYVESVSGGMVTVSEMNYGGGWNRISRRTAPASSFRYIY